MGLEAKIDSIRNMNSEDELLDFMSTDETKIFINSLSGEKKDKFFKLIKNLFQSIKNRANAMENHSHSALVLVSIIANLDNFWRYGRYFFIFSEVEEYIKSFPWPKKQKNKLTQKWQLLGELEKFEKQLRGLVFGMNFYDSSFEKRVIHFIYSLPKKRIPRTPEESEKMTETDQWISKQTWQPRQNTETIIENFGTQTSQKISTLLTKISTRLINLENKDDPSLYLDELDKMAEKLDKLEHHRDEIQPEIQEQITSVKETVNNMIEQIQNSDHISEVQNSEENPENSQKIEEIISTPKPDFFTGTEYEKFLQFLLSEEGFHYSLSNTKNPLIKNSQWDGSFAMKIARPLFYQVEYVFKNFSLNPEDISWKEISETILEHSEVKEEVRHFLNILKNFEKKSDLISILPEFSEAVDILSKTKFYHNGNEPLLSIQFRLQNIIETFGKNS